MLRWATMHRSAVVMKATHTLISVIMVAILVDTVTLAAMVDGKAASAAVMISVPANIIMNMSNTLQSRRRSQCKYLTLRFAPTDAAFDRFCF